MLTRIGRWSLELSRTSPLTDVVGLARTMLALATLSTLLANHESVLFRPAQGMPPAPYCEGVSAISLYCVATPSIGRWVSVVVLLVVLSGWRPRFTALPHWWAAFSLQVSGTVVDGGDQVASVLAFLLVPLCLMDGRRNHWHRPREVAGAQPGSLRLFGAWVVGFLIRLQVAVLYFHAGVGKFAVDEWRDGTAMYYWLLDPSFGIPGWMVPLMTPVLMHGTSVALFSWLVVLGEIVLAMALVMPRTYWPPLLVAGIAFHAGIAVMMGLVSFAFAMVAADLLFLHPLDRRLGLARLAGRVRPRLARPDVLRRSRLVVPAPVQAAPVQLAPVPATEREAVR